MPSHVKCINIPLRISGYLDLVHFENPLLITEGMGLDAILDMLEEAIFLFVNLNFAEVI